MATAFAPNLLAGKNAFVMGGTRGMNLEIAKRFAEHGANVAVSSRSPERCAAAQAELETLGVKALGLPADVRDYDRVAAIMKEAADAFGGTFDIVVAGQAGNFYAPAIGMSSNGFQSIIDIDLVGSFNVFRAAFEYLTKPGATCLAITAPEAVRPLPFQAHVCAAKAGLNMLLKCLAVEWGPAGVRVNGISPGPIEDSWGMKNVVAITPEIHDQITQAVPLRRWGTVAEVADAALFLSSPSAHYVTGTILDVDGGVTIATPDHNADAVNDPKADPRVANRADKEL